MSVRDIYGVRSDTIQAHLVFDLEACNNFVQRLAKLLPTMGIVEPNKPQEGSLERPVPWELLLDP